MVLWAVMLLSLVLVQQGGDGRQNGSVGWGGGGGARVDRTWIPRALLGHTYSVTIGKGGVTSGEIGTSSVFRSEILY